MTPRKVHVLLYILYCVCMFECNVVFVQFVNVDFLEGNILHETSRSSVIGCAAACGQHSPSCRGSRYSVATKECQLLDKSSSTITTTIYAAAGWTIFMVFHNLIYFNNNLPVILCCYEHILSYASFVSANNK